jgi:DNA-binding NarL/FixJ family response regulator
MAKLHLLADTHQASAAFAFETLVVEDHEATRQAIAALLALAFPGSRVRTADSAELALQACSVHPPDVVILDIALPHMNGLEAARQLAAQHPEVRIVMHSNHDSEVYRDEALAAGARGFVSKARTATELVPAVARLVATQA